MMKRLMVLALLSCCIIAPTECGKNGKKKEKQGGNSTSIIQIQQGNASKDILGKISESKDLLLKNIGEFKDNHPKVLPCSIAATGFALGASGISYENIDPSRCIILGLLAANALCCYKVDTLTHDDFGRQHPGILGSYKAENLIAGLITINCILNLFSMFCSIGHPEAVNPIAAGMVPSMLSIFFYIYKLNEVLPIKK